MADVAENDLVRVRARLVGGRNLFSISELYHENSKITPAAMGIAQSAESVLVAASGFKRYIHSVTMKLPPPAAEQISPMCSAIRKRRSCRDYSGAAIGLTAISELVYYALGISEGYHRCVPSAGGLYPLELYAIALNVDGLAPGLYHYNVRSHGLSQLDTQDFREQLGQSIVITEAVQKAAAVLIITAVFGRLKIKYGERAYRFALLEAGHAMQNICLAATVIGLGTCPVGGFIDDGINDLVDVDGVEEAAIYAATVGVPA